MYVGRERGNLTAATEYMSKSREDYFAGDEGMKGLEGTMVGTVEVTGTFVNWYTLFGTMKNSFDCQDGDCDGFGMHKPLCAGKELFGGTCRVCRRRRIKVFATFCFLSSGF